MKVGYPCINWTLPCFGNKSFRLKSYSEERLIETVQNNLDCLQAMLEYNVEYELRFFRISSDLVPFASHEINDFPWDEHFAEQFASIGEYIRKHGFRISMHPDQFTVLNSPNPNVVQNAIGELEYHNRVLNALGLDTSAKIQIHVGGVYNDKSASIDRFITNFRELDTDIQDLLVIENDDRSYSLSDCMKIHSEIGIPVLFDIFHHEILNHDESLSEAMKQAASTWGGADGIPMIDYSSQSSGERIGKHAQTVDIAHFRQVFEALESFDYDMMLEIKNKETSALQVIEFIRENYAEKL